MSPIKMTGWPVVIISFNASASDRHARQWLDNMSSLLDKKQPFVMVMKANPESHFSPNARKQLGLWFKEHRQALSQYCLGTARVVDSIKHGKRVVSDNMKKAMPFPMQAFLSQEEAENWAKKHLAI